MPKNPAIPDRVVDAHGRQDRAVDALDAHLDLISWTETREAHTIIRSFVGSVAGRTRTWDGEEVEARAMQARWRDELPGFPTYYVTGEMTRLAFIASADLEPCPVLMPQDLPSLSGFIYFSSAPSSHIDLNAKPEHEDRLWLAGLDIKIRAVSWSVEDVMWNDEDGSASKHRGVVYVIWLDGETVKAAMTKVVNEHLARAAELDREYADLCERFGFAETETEGKKALVSEQVLDDETSLMMARLTMERAEAEARLRMLKGSYEAASISRWLPLELQAWRFGAPYELTTDRESARSGLVVEEVEWQRRFLTAIWSLMGQEIAIIDNAHLDRAARRRMLRFQKKEPRFGDVKIVRLRRGYDPLLELLDEIPDEDLSSAGEREWTHRWMVRGHWRNARVGKGRTETKRVWVVPHIKGPQDKPLILRDTVYSLER